MYLLLWLIAVGWNDSVVLCTLDCMYTVYWQKDFWNFIVCTAYEAGTIWQFHFLYFMFRLWYDRYILTMMTVGRLISHTFSTRMFHVAHEPTLLVVLYASITIFLLCIKCAYVNRSHGNAFSCNMCCLSFLPCFIYVVVMFFMSDFKGLKIFSKS